MPHNLVHVTLVVRDYDEAIDFFVGTLGFDLLQDSYQPDQDKRWVLVRPKGGSGCSIVLGRPSDPRQHDFIGDQTGGRVTFFLQTDDFWRDHHLFKERGVEFTREPKTESYGTVAVFKDLYGNLWDLVEFA